MYILIACALMIFASMFAVAQTSPGITLKTRTTSTVDVKGEMRPSRSHSQAMYIQGSRKRTDDTWDAFENVAANTSSRIEQCDLKRMVFLQHGPRVYDMMPFPDEAAQRASEERMQKAIADYKAGKLKTIPAPANTPVIKIETIDTGERKEVGGFTLRHIKQTENQPAQVAGGQGERNDVKDGWYVDLPDPQQCPEYKVPKGWKRATVAFVSAGVDVFPRLELKGNAPPRLPTAVEETHTTKYGDGTTLTEKTELVEFSQGPVDPELFEIPQGYRPALHTPNGGRDLMQPDTLINRMRAWWDYYRLRWHMR
jgi:hypothetical protein